MYPDVICTRRLPTFDTKLEPEVLYEDKYYLLWKFSKGTIITYYRTTTFASNGAWDSNVCVLMAERTLITCIVIGILVHVDCCYCLLVLSMVWDCNKNKASALEAIILGRAKKILGCSSKTCNEAVRRDMGLDSLSNTQDSAKLKWWHYLCTTKGDRYPRQLFDQVWEVKPRRGRQRKMWGKRVDDIIEAILLDKEELLDGIKNGNRKK